MATKASGRLTFNMWIPLAWRTAKSKFPRIIAFWIPDKRKLGLRQLELCVNHCLYSPNEASYGLIAAYLEYGKYERAINVFDRNLAKKRTPSLSGMYYMGRLLIESKRLREAESIFRNILQRLEKYKFASVGYQVECKYWIALSLKAENKTSEALQLTGAALAQSKKRNAALELEGPFENFREIQDRLERLHNGLKKTKV
ncbi:MAG: tol-pal system YbgF family protein [Candidatus Hodarchaeota archaeon]